MTAYQTWHKAARAAIDEGRKFSMLPTTKRVSLADVTAKLRAMA